MPSRHYSNNIGEAASAASGAQTISGADEERSSLESVAGQSSLNNATTTTATSHQPTTNNQQVVNKSDQFKTTMKSKTAILFEMSKPKIVIDSPDSVDSLEARFVRSSTNDATAAAAKITNNLSGSFVVDSNQGTQLVGNIKNNNNSSDFCFSEKQCNKNQKQAYGGGGGCKSRGGDNVIVVAVDNNNIEDFDELTSNATKVYKKRYLMLALFCAYSAINSFQWIQYSSVTSVISIYYNASNMQVNLTSLIYMLTYIPFIIHASLMLEKVGLRKAVLIGTFGTALGSLLKWQFGSAPNIESFWWLMAGQTIVALSQLFVISVPPLLASVWFPDNQVSTATGIGVFGNQLGIALGFIMPPMFIHNNQLLEAHSSSVNVNNNNATFASSSPAVANLTQQTIDDCMALIGADLYSLSTRVSLLASLICIAAILFFKDKPDLPPGSASLRVARQQRKKLQQLASQRTTITTLDGLTDVEHANNNKQQLDSQQRRVSIQSNNDTANLSAIFGLCKDRNFFYLILSYGINTGCFYAVSTVLNQMMATKFPQLIELAGQMGLLLVISGMAGSILCGHVLDKTHAYRTIIVLVYLFSLVSMLLFTLTIHYSETVYPLHVAATVLGFFMTGYLSLGYEFAAEITYPHPANTPAGLLNMSAQIIGFMLTYLSSMIVDSYGGVWTNLFLTLCLVIGFILTVVTKAELRRQKAVTEEKSLSAVIQTNNQ